MHSDTRLRTLSRHSPACRRIILHLSRSRTVFSDVHLCILTQTSSVMSFYCFMRRAGPLIWQPYGCWAGAPLHFTAAVSHSVSAVQLHTFAPIILCCAACCSIGKHGISTSHCGLSSSSCLAECTRPDRAVMCCVSLCLRTLLQHQSSCLVCIGCPAEYTCLGRAESCCRKSVAAPAVVTLVYWLYGRYTRHLPVVMCCVSLCRRALLQHQSS